MSVIDARFHRWEHRISAANTSFIAERSTVKRGIPFVRQRSSLKLRSMRFVVRQRTFSAATGTRLRVVPARRRTLGQDSVDASRKRAHADDRRRDGMEPKAGRWELVEPS